jgi:AraC-like DNA-binding protein
VHIESRPRRGVPFFGTLNAAMIGDIQLSQVASVAQTIVHGPRHIGHDSAYVCLVVQIAGRGQISQDGREAELAPDDFAMTDSTRPFQLDFDREFALAALHVPYELMHRRIGPPERFTAHRIDGQRGFGGFLSSILRNLAPQLPDISAAAHQRVGGNVLDLVATGLLSDCEPAPIPSVMTRVRVKFWIDSHLAEDLSGERFAAACGISVRHLNRLFASEGTSLMHYSWERRLDHCRRDLTDPAMGHRPIGEIALAAGFKDLSHFSRAYRIRFGLTARDDRAAAAWRITSLALESSPLRFSRRGRRA